MKDYANQDRNQELEQLEELLSLQSMFELDDFDAAQLWRLRSSLGDQVVGDMEGEINRSVGDLEAAWALSEAQELPGNLREQLLNNVPDQVVQPREDYGRLFSAETEKVVVKESSTVGSGRSLNQWLGWAAAAACLVVAVGVSMNPAGDDPRLVAYKDPNADVAQRYAKELYSEMEKFAGSRDITRVGWKDKDGKELPGDFIWDSKKQVGVMRLSVLPGQIKPDEDYQLWIFDPERKRRGDANDRVGGPVFKLDQNETFILVQSPLHIFDVSQFAITVEPSKGVVESKLENVAALSEAK